MREGQGGSGRHMPSGDWAPPNPGRGEGVQIQGGLTTQLGGAWPLARGVCSLRDCRPPAQGVLQPLLGSWLLRRHAAAMGTCL